MLITWQAAMAGHQPVEFKLRVVAFNGLFLESSKSALKQAVYKTPAFTDSNIREKRLGKDLDSR